MARPSRSTVFCIVRDSGARRILAAAARAAHAKLVECKRDDFLRRSGTVDGVQALIYDLSPWNAVAERFLAEVRERRPHVPILIYAPPAPSVGEFITKAITMGVTKVELHCEGVGERERIAKAVEELIATFASTLLTPIIKEVIGSAHQRVEGFVEEGVCRALTPTVGSHLRPKDVAAARGTGLRTLERDLNKAGLPAPQELLDWIRLLSICFVSHWNGVAAGRVARGIGLTPNALYRLRQRRLSDSPEAAASDTAEAKRENEFKAVLAHFARRCDNYAIDPEVVLENLVA